ncbi:MAG TPA: hypothetical protein VFQ81_06115 [Candidatus Limnocylindria bacterium]|nr:hypothetical protein [Candidatus Limnocylindria bacterium]
MNSSAASVSGSGNRTLLAIGAAVIGLVIITVAVVLAAGNRGPVAYPADSPEGVLQAYLTAVEDGDAAGAHAYFSAEVRERMDLDAFEAALEDHARYAPESSRRVLFDRRDGEGDHVRLHLVVEEFYGDGLEGSTNRTSREIRLVREDGTWRIDEPLAWLDPASFEPTFR